MITRYISKIDDKVLELEHEITNEGIQRLCQAHGVKFIGMRTSHYHHWFQKVKEVTYVFKSE